MSEAASRVLPPMSLRTLPLRGIGSYLRGKRTPSRVLCDDVLQRLMPQLTGDVIEIGGTHRRNYGRFATKAARYTITNIAGDCDEIADAMCLPYATDSVDAIMCANVLEHIPRPWVAASEMQRVLKPGGQLLVVVPFLYGFHSIPHDYYRFTATALADLFSELEIIHFEAQGTRCAVIALLLQRPESAWLTYLGRLIGAGFYLLDSLAGSRAVAVKPPAAPFKYALLLRKPVGSAAMRNGID